MDEVNHVQRDKFGWTDEAIKLAQGQIADFREEVQPGRAIDGEIPRAATSALRFMTFS
jgi:hypothetical protein